MGSRRRREQDDQNAWTPRDDALWSTAEIAALTLQGRLTQRQALPVPFAMQYGDDERVVAFGPHTLLEWRGQGDGSYAHSTTTALAVGKGAIPFMIGAAAVTAAGNAARRRAAAAAAQARWVRVGEGTISVSNGGFYLHDQAGLWPWNWSSVTMAELTAPGNLFLQGNSQRGPVQWTIASDWAELVFFLWANVCAPHHPQYRSRLWLPDDFLTRAMARAMGGHAYPDHRTFSEVVRALPGA